LDLIQSITLLEIIYYADIIPTGTSDKDVIKVFNSYVDIPALILTSDKDLYRKLFGRSLFAKAKKGSDPVRIVIKAENTEFQGYN
jgi:hypothetical protein